MKANSARGRAVGRRASLDERSDRTTRTLDDHWNVEFVSCVQSSGVDDPSPVHSVACQRNDGVTTHCAVAVVVHEDHRQIGVTCNNIHDDRAVATGGISVYIPPKISLP